MSTAKIGRVCGGTTEWNKAIGRRQRATQQEGFLKNFGVTE